MKAALSGGAKYARRTPSMDATPRLDGAEFDEHALLELIETIGALAYDYDLALDRYVRVRGGEAARLGFSEQDWLKSGFWAARLHAEDRERAHGFCVDSILAQRDHQFEYRMQSAGGQTIWILDHVRLVRRAGVPVALRGLMLDVTQLKQQQRELAQLHERFAGLLDQLSAGVLFEDHQRRISFANSALCAAFGVESAQALLGVDCRDALAALKHKFHDPDAAVRRIESLVEARETQLAEEIRLRDGRVMERSYTAVVEGGELRGHLWEFNEVTHRRRAERALRDVSSATASRTGSAYIETLVGELTCALGASIAFVADLRAEDPGALHVLALRRAGRTERGRRLGLHDAPCELTLERGELVCDGDLAARFPEHFAVREYGARSFLGVRLWSSSSQPSGVLALLFDGPIPDLAANLSILRVLAGRAGAELERERAEHALRASEARNRALLESFPDLIFVVDSRGVFHDCHAPAPELLLVPREEFLGRRLEDVLPGSTGALFRELLDEAFRTRASLRRELALDMPDGPRRFEYRVECFGEDRALVIARDVTELRRAEERALQTQKLESIGRLAGGVSHDFNNLLTAILSYAELGAQQAGAGPLAEHFRRIQLAGERAAGLTRQLLAFAREERVESRIVSLNALVEEMLAFLPRLIGEHVELRVDLAADLWRTSIDPSQLYSVLMNLVVNARDAMPEGGSIHIRTRNIVSDADSEHPAGEWVELEVRDIGVGMDEHTRRRVFEPFFTTKGAGAGVGMGLATSYGIVRQNGGTIVIASDLGAGTTVTVRLPRSLDVETVHGAASHAALPAGECVLIVEDDAVVREIAVTCLRGRGYRVLEACDGVQALELCEQRLAEIDIVVTDMIMPRMGGDALAAALRSLRPQLPVLFISGYSPTADEHARAATLLRKPFAPSDLARKLREVLESRAKAR